MPIEPIDPSKKVGGDGNEKYNPQKEKFGPSEFDKKAEKVKQENEKAKAEIHRIAEEQRAKAKAESPRTYTERLQDMDRLQKSSGSSPSGMIDPMERKTKPFNKAKGGVVKSLEKAGFYVKGKTKSEREKIVSKVTTKPQRIGMVEKMFSAKKMKAGGMASKRADGIAIRGRTKA